MRKFLQIFPFHTFLFIFFISIFLFAQNYDHIKTYMLMRTVLVGSILAIILYVFFYFFNRNKIKSGIISTLILLTLFNYGVVYDVLEGLYYRGFWPFKNIHRYLLGMTFLFCIFIIWLIQKKIHVGIKTNYFLNLLILILMGYNLSKLVYFSFRSNNNSPINSEKNIVSIKNNHLPNLYFIILDGYANQHVLKKYYHFDNSDFINFLEENNFYVADSSISNYYSTQPSLSSTFNLGYLPSNSTEYLKSLRDNSLFRILKSQGYKLYTLQSGYAVTSGFSLTDSIIRINAPNEFERSILKFTVCRLDDLFGIVHYRRLKSQIEKLDDIAKINQSKRFIFIHMVSPHPPFVFNKNGEHSYNNKNSDNSWEPKENYVNQIIYLNKVIKRFISNIILLDKKSVIILQSDHGPWIQSPNEDSVFEARSMIINAMRYPELHTNQLTKSISSVNTFRLFIKNYIDSGFVLLPNKAAGKLEIYNSILFKNKKENL